MTSPADTVDESMSVACLVASTSAEAEVLVAMPSYHLREGQLVRWGTGGFGVPDRYVLALRLAVCSFPALFLPTPSSGVNGSGRSSRVRRGGGR